MKRFVKYFLVVLTVCGYLTSTLEVDSKECRQNYSKENKTSVSADNTVAKHSIHTDFVADVPAPNFSDTFAATVVQQSSTFQFGNDPGPPERLFLRHSVLLI